MLFNEFKLTWFNLLFQYGLNMVIQHTDAINSIALSLMHKSLRYIIIILYV